MIGVVSVTKSNLTWRQARPALARPFYPSAPGAGAKNMLKKWSLDQITPWKMCNLIPEPPQVCTLYLFIDTKGFTQSRLFTVVWDPVSSSCLLRKFSTTFSIIWSFGEKSKSCYHCTMIYCVVTSHCRGRHQSSLAKLPFHEYLIWYVRYDMFSPPPRWEKHWAVAQL